MGTFKEGFERGLTVNYRILTILTLILVGAGCANHEQSPIVAPDTQDVSKSKAKCLIMEEVRAILEAEKDKMLHCYEKELQSNPSLAGEVVLVMQVAPSGHVHTAITPKSTMKSPEVEACMIEVAKELRFSMRCEEKVYPIITFPYTFKPAK